MTPREKHPTKNSTNHYEILKQITYPNEFKVFAELRPGDFLQWNTVFWPPKTALLSPIFNELEMKIGEIILIIDCKFVLHSVGLDPWCEVRIIAKSHKGIKRAFLVLDRYHNPTRYLTKL